MKKIINIVLILTLMILSAAACSVPGSAGTIATPTEEPTAAPTEEPTAVPTEIPTEEPTEEPAQEPAVEPAVSEPHSSVLVVYFSRVGEQYGVGVIDKGNTEIVAEMIAESTGADLWQVVPEVDNYPLTYAALTDIAKQEQNQNARPAYDDTDFPSLMEYDTIFIGAPVWWGDWPMIMYTFFEQNEEELSGKTLYPFSTHAGSGLSGFDTKLANTLPLSYVGSGYAASGSDVQNSTEYIRLMVNNWVESLGF